MTKILSIVVPCYNEEEALPHTARALAKLVQDLQVEGLASAGSAVYFVDDGSQDKTWDVICRLHRENPFFCGLKLSRNRGHQNALVAGLLAAPGDIVVSIDADLQDDVNAIRDMIRVSNEGADIVYGVRRDRSEDSFFKRSTAAGFYRLTQWLGVELITHHADFRLMSRRAIEALAEYGEVNLFLRGIIPQLGFKTDRVYYARAARIGGTSKYPLKKMLALALNGVTSFSIQPLRFITLTGFAVSFASLVLVVWGLAIRFFTDKALPGWASIVTPMYFLGGIQMLSLGIIGEYLGKAYMETKHRPRFIVETALEGAQKIIDRQPYRNKA